MYFLPATFSATKTKTERFYFIFISLSPLLLKKIPKIKEPKAVVYMNFSLFRLRSNYIFRFSVRGEQRLEFVVRWWVERTFFPVFLLFKFAIKGWCSFPVRFLSVCPLSLFQLISLFQNSVDIWPDQSTATASRRRSSYLWSPYLPNNIFFPSTCQPL